MEDDGVRVLLFRKGNLVDDFVVERDPEMALARKLERGEQAEAELEAVRASLTRMEKKLAAHRGASAIQKKKREIWRAWEQGSGQMVSEAEEAAPRKHSRIRCREEGYERSASGPLPPMYSHRGNGSLRPKSTLPH